MVISTVVLVSDAPDLQPGEAEDGAVCQHPGECLRIAWGAHQDGPSTVGLQAAEGVEQPQSTSSDRSSARRQVLTARGCAVAPITCQRPGGQRVHPSPRP